MTARLTLLDRQDGVEQQHALPSPELQIAGRGHRTELARQLRVDVAQARRKAHAFGHGEGQAVRLSGTVVRVLPEDRNPHTGQRRQLERVQHPRRIDAGAGRASCFEKRQ